MAAIKILIVDDHAILRTGLASVLGRKQELYIAGEASNGAEAVRKAAELSPDVIVMDLVMPEMDGTEATRRILENNPDTKILVLTTFGTSDALARVLRAGAKGAVLKDADFAEIETAIRNVAAGGTYISAEIKRILSDDPPAAPLTARQNDVLRALVKGNTNKEIAAMLGISTDMVKEHLTGLFAKLGAYNRAEAVAIAIRKGLV